MGLVSGVAWTDASWSPWTGCHKVSPGCDNCYAEREMVRFGRDPHLVRRTSAKTFTAPLKWPAGLRVFVCPWSDFFHPEADGWRPDAWEVMRRRPDLTFIVLTKRVNLVRSRLPDGWGNGWANVWLGATAEDQERTELRLPQLVVLPAAKRVVSVEPMLGPVSLERWLGPGRCSDPQCGDSTWDHACGLGGPRVHWVLVGSESGARPRLIELKWVRDVRDQCVRSGTALFLKQLPGGAGGRLVVRPELDGRRWEQVP